MIRSSGVNKVTNLVQIREQPIFSVTNIERQVMGEEISLLLNDIKSEHLG